MVFLNNILVLRKRNSGERNLWWSEWLVVLRCLDEFGDSSDSVFRGIGECQLVYETLISDSTELEGVSSQFGHWTISMSSDNWVCWDIKDWWITMNSLNGRRWCFLYFVFTKSTEISKTQCLQWFPTFCFRFENPLYDSSKLDRTTSDWTVYNGSQIEVDWSRSTFRMSFVLKSSELLLYSSKVWVTECGGG